MGMTQFVVNVSDALSEVLDAVSKETDASRSRVLAVLIRVHIHQLTRFMGTRRDRLDEDTAAVTVEEIGDRGDISFLEACTRYPPELALLVKTLGLTNTLER
jgi:hypothetical protein